MPIGILSSSSNQMTVSLVSSSFTVCLNSISFAAFFKAADYGIVGDAFEVVPQLIEKLKEFKAQNA